MTGPGILLLVLLAFPGTVLAEGVVRIPRDVAVEGETILLGEIAVIDGLPPSERERLGSLALGPSAQPAHDRVFSGEGLREQIAVLAPHAVLDIAEQVRVHTAYREVGPDYLRARLEDALRRKMPWDPSAARFSAWRLPARFPVPVRAQRLLVHFRPDEDFLGRVTARLELLDAARPEARRVARAASVMVDVRLPVVVTRKALRRGAILDADTVALEERELRALPRGTLTDLQQAIGKRVARGLAAGAVLLPGALRREPLVRRGDAITVQAGRAGLDLQIEARALEEGGLGETIRVENPGTRRRFLAEVTGPASGTLSLPDVGSGP